MEGRTLYVLIAYISFKSRDLNFLHPDSLYQSPHYVQVLVTIQQLPGSKRWIYLGKGLTKRSTGVK